MSLFVNYPSWISPFVFPGLPIRWYAVMYLFAFGTAFIFFNKEVKEDRTIRINKDQTENVVLWTIAGLLLGARIGSCLFYDDAAYYLLRPWMMFWPFQDGHFIGLPGMSYHGGLVGGILACWLYCRHIRVSFLHIADLLTAAIPFGYTFGRLGNFFNAELYGRVTSSALGMVFPYAERFSTLEGWVRDVADACGIQYTLGDYVNLPRWPSQLFEALFEGIVLGLLLWFVVRGIKAKYRMKDGTVFGFYVIGYGFFRFFIEYFRQPDLDIGYVLAWGAQSDNVHVFQSLFNISKGQVFCAMMMLGGALLVVLANIFGKVPEEIKGKNRKGR